MSTTRLRLVVTGETLFPRACPRPEFATANSGLAMVPCTPFSLRMWGTSRFPTSRHAHSATKVAL